MRKITPKQRQRNIRKAAAAERRKLGLAGDATIETIDSVASTTSKHKIFGEDHVDLIFGQVTYAPGAPEDAPRCRVIVFLFFLGHDELAVVRSAGHLVSAPGRRGCRWRKGSRSRRTRRSGSARFPYQKSDAAEMAF